MYTMKIICKLRHGLEGAFEFRFIFSNGIKLHNLRWRQCFSWGKLRLRALKRAQQYFKVENLFLIGKEKHTLSRGIDEGQARQRLKNVPIMQAKFSFTSIPRCKVIFNPFSGDFFHFLPCDKINGLQMELYSKVLRMLLHN